MQLRYQAVVKVVPVCAWVTLLMLVTALWIAPPVSFNDWLFYSLVLLVMSTLVAALTLEIFRSRIGVNESHLVVTKNFRRKFRVSWEDIEHIEYRTLWSAFLVVTKDGKRFFVSTLMTNLTHFITLMASALPREKYITALDKFAKSFGK